MRTIFLSVALTALLTSCTTARTIIGPDGSMHLLVSCGGKESCYEDAMKACGGKYKIVSTYNEGLTDPNNPTAVTKMLVKCEDSTSTN